MERETGEIPDSLDGRLVAATGSCVAIGTYCEQDGTTEIAMTDDQAFPLPGSWPHLVYEGLLSTPHGQLDICTVDLKKVISLKVADNLSAVEIWANDLVEPNRLCVVVGLRVKQGK
jgi:hypothetical protein